MNKTLPAFTLAAVVSIVSWTIPLASASATSGGLSGAWSYVVEQACIPNATLDPRSICGQLLGGPDGGSWSNWLEATTTSNGVVTFQAGFIATEDDAKAPHLCSIKIFTQNFNGSCYVTDHGHGFIKRDKAGTPYLSDQWRDGHLSWP